MTEIMESKRGHEEVLFDDLRQISPLEPETKSYTPLAHYEFAHNVNRIGEMILGPQGFSLNGARYCVSNDGGKMFMTQEFDHEERDDIKLAIAGRNSTDKSMLAAVAVGGQVTVCTNGIISGEITVMRKHTGNVFQYLEDNLILSFHKATNGWHDLQNDIRLMQEIPVDDSEAYRLIGEMWGKRIISPNQMNPVRKHWEENEQFPNRDLWRLYNGVTDVFKGLPPQTIMKKHLQLHDWSREKTATEVLEIQADYSVEGTENGS